MDWLIFLSGEDHLMDIISESIPEELFKCGPGGKYALFYSAEDGISSEGEALRSAEEKVELLNGISRLILNQNPCINITNISNAGDFHEDLLKVSSEKRSEDVIICCDDEGDEEEISIKNPIESLLIVSESDECLNSALRDLGHDFESWEGFLNIYKKIESCNGSPVEKGWCLEDERDWFLTSAERTLSPMRDEDDAVGDLMYNAEAESFVTILMQEWIKEKKREMNI